MTKYLLLLVSVLAFASCDRYDDEILPVIGVYEAHIVGITGPESISISIDHGDHIFIEAPFDGFEWIVVEADIENKHEYEKDIDIDRQNVGPNTEIWGNGIFFEGTIQLDYTMRFGDEEYDFTLIGTKY